MELDEDKSIELFNELSKLKLNLIKECYEIFGMDYGDIKPDKPLVKYRNYMISEPISIAGFGGSIDDNYDVGEALLSTGQVKANAEKVISSLMTSLGLTKAQAAGIAGVLTSESQINPHIVNKGEKNGTYNASGANNLGTPYGTKHCAWSYGAGICQWTFTQRKESAIAGGLNVSKEKAKQIILHGGIESLSLEQQISMLVYELKNTYKNTLIGLKKCSSAEQAAATYYCHCVTGYSSSTEPATQAEIDQKNKAYSTVGANSQINKGMRYAKGYVQ